ncbi:hypothetical protein SAMN05444380_108136 [Thermophagus xiamenensis]|uniref:Transposase DDE domain-containing protein n=1 Tax=Thermophagus xiamenensis TaxID=385682 RepID=A0A1I1YV92_9BACT|nr:hypothetical protein SAMN05444380_108136 [Thermophagus xiamenensis]
MPRQQNWNRTVMSKALNHLRNVMLNLINFKKLAEEHLIYTAQRII